MGWLLLAVLFGLVLALVVGLDQLCRRNLQRWLPTYVRERARRRDPRPDEEVHLLLCIADHFEPHGANPRSNQATVMVQRWARDYPQLFGTFRDSDGRPPRHTFFYPIDEYDAGNMEALAGLCRAGFGEIEVHLHHEDDTAEELRSALLAFKGLLSSKHGLLPRHRQTGEVMYGFVHGNWALNNSGPEGKHCGVNNELEVLRQTGCYADFTLPSAPSSCQTRTINRLYYGVSDPQRPKGHDRGVAVGEGLRPANGLLLVQGPLLLNWQKRKLGLAPHIENSCLQASQPPSFERLGLWLRARIQAPQRPDWFFVKLHAHGAVPSSADLLLGEPMERFHRDLAALAQRNPRFHYHYLTAREMYNLVKAAEAGWQGTVAGALDYELIGPAAAPAFPLSHTDRPRADTRVCS